MADKSQEWQQGHTMLTYCWNGEDDRCKYKYRYNY